MISGNRPSITPGPQPRRPHLPRFGDDFVPDGFEAGGGIDGGRGDGVDEVGGHALEVAQAAQPEVLFGCGRVGRGGQGGLQIVDVGGHVFFAHLIEGGVGGNLAGEGLEQRGQGVVTEAGGGVAGGNVAVNQGSQHAAVAGGEGAAGDDDVAGAAVDGLGVAGLPPGGIGHGRRRVDRIGRGGGQQAAQAGQFPLDVLDFDGDGGIDVEALAGLLEFELVQPSLSFVDLLG